MSDLDLRQLLKAKYNVVIGDLDCIEMSCIQPVINTVRQYDNTRDTAIMNELIEKVKIYDSKWSESGLIQKIDVYDLIREVLGSE